MILTTHILASTAVSRYIAGGNPIVAFFWGWLSHYILDSLPHTDYGINCLSEKGLVQVSRRKKISDYARVGTEAVIGSLISLWLIQPHNLYQFLYWAAVVTGGVMPDFLHYLNNVVGLKVPQFLTKFHEGIHTKIKLRYTHPYWGGISQFIICSIAIYFAK